MYACLHAWPRRRQVTAAARMLLIAVCGVLCFASQLACLACVSGACVSTRRYFTCLDALLRHF